MGKKKTEIFLRMGLDSESAICPSGAIRPPGNILIVILRREPLFGEPRRMLLCSLSFEARKSAHLQR